MSSCQCDMHGRGNAAHCRKCCLTFSGTWAFDRHLRAGKHMLPYEVGLAEVRPGVYGKPWDVIARERPASWRP